MFIKEFFVGNKFLQRIFERLYRLSLRGMHYGLGGMISTSGEKHVMAEVNTRLNDQNVSEKIVFDVGANHGQYTTELLEIFDKKTTVYCFEPSGYSFKKLEELLGNVSNVELIPYGLGSTSEHRRLFYDVEGSGWASVFERRDTGFNHPLHESEEIRLTTLDQFCASRGIETIHFLKADVEGFELSVLQGARQMLPNIQYIQFEFSFANYNSKTYLFDFFEMLTDFEIYRVLRNGLWPITYDPRYEVLMTTNYLAVNKRMDSQKKPA